MLLNTPSHWCSLFSVSFAQCHTVPILVGLVSSETLHWLMSMRPSEECCHALMPMLLLTTQSYLNDGVKQICYSKDTNLSYKMSLWNIV